MCCLQEHWLSDAQLPLLSNISYHFAYAGVSGFTNSEVLRGRPYGGCAVMWRQDIDITVDVHAVDSRRICAVRFNASEWKLLIVCVCTCRLRMEQR